MVRADTMVWSEGMAGWQKAGEIAELISGTDGARHHNELRGREALDRFRNLGV
jgi:GYF domain 2